HSSPTRRSSDLALFEPVGHAHELALALPDLITVTDPDGHSVTYPDEHPVPLADGGCAQAQTQTQAETETGSEAQAAGVLQRRRNGARVGEDPDRQALRVGKRWSQLV